MALFLSSNIKYDTGEGCFGLSKEKKTAELTRLLLNNLIKMFLATLLPLTRKKMSKCQLATLFWVSQCKMFHLVTLFWHIEC